MKKNRFALMLGIAAILLVAFAGVAIGSNMGFKLNRSLTQLNGSGGAANNWVSIPYNNNYTNAAQLKTDITNCTQVSRWNKSTAAFESYLTGGRGEVNFAISAGEGYLSRVSANANWTVVGSHNPSTSVSMTQLNGSGGAANNWTAVPYHTTATNAAGLKGQITNCSQVSRWNPSTAAFESYLTGGRGETNFTVTAGEAYLVRVSANSSWTPAHY